MRRTTILVLSLACGMLLMACTTTETTNNSNVAVVTSTPATATTPATTTASTSGASIGVPECDDFLKKYDSCAAKVPEMVRAQYENAGKEMRDQWKKWAENPQTKGSLASTCKQAADAQATAWKMYGCAN